MAGNIKPRKTRYQIDKYIVVMARPVGMRFYCFELIAHNISESGILLSNDRKVFVPLRTNDDLNITFDFSCVHFQRPIHMIVAVTRTEIKEGKQYFGVKISKIQPEHKSIFIEGLIKLPLLPTSTKDAEWT